jgi:translation initiation factor 4G
MTSVVQQANKPSHTRNSGAPQTSRPTHLPSNAAGPSSPAIPGAEEKHSPPLSALKRPLPPNAFRPPTMSGAVESTPPPDSNSLLNGKNTTATAAPSLSGPTIVNGNSIDHSRKSSFTVVPSNAANFGSNGGPVGAAQTKANNIQFGSMNNAGSPVPSQSPALGNPSSANLEVASLNPRIASPQTTPSPIPHLAASGGIPPPSRPGQGNGYSFGQIGEDGGDANVSHVRVVRIKAI